LLAFLLFRSQFVRSSGRFSRVKCDLSG